ncbi:MAG: hypothetical protein MJB12_18585 [Firmicutes bacterium]|nr:hypothetical protein [Bacillota bacterium]
MGSNHTYAYGMFILGVICILGGFISLKDNITNLQGVGTIFLGLLLITQYLKAQGRAPQSIIRILTWAVIFGFLIVNTILIFNMLK